MDDLSRQKKQIPSFEDALMSVLILLIFVSITLAVFMFFNGTGYREPSLVSIIRHLFLFCVSLLSAILILYGIFAIDGIDIVAYYKLSTSLFLTTIFVLFLYLSCYTFSGWYYGMPIEEIAGERLNIDAGYKIDGIPKTRIEFFQKTGIDTLKLGGE